MLQSINKHLTGWIAAFIIILISLSFGLWGIQYYLRPSSGNQSVVAKVYGHNITEKSLNALSQTIVRHYTTQLGHPLSESERQQIRQYALQKLILDKVLALSAKRAGFYVGRKQIDQAVMALPLLQEHQQFSLARYKQLLFLNALTPTQFAEKMRNRLMLNQLENGIKNSVFVLPNELQAIYLLDKQTRDFHYAVISSERFLKTVQVSSKDIKQYYDKHQDHFRIPAQVKIQYLILDPAMIAKTVKMSDEAVRHYYEAHTGNYRTLKRWQVQRIDLPLKGTQQQRKAIVARLKHPHPLESWIKEKKGVTQWLTRANTITPVLDAVSILKPGEVSSWIQTDAGVSIFRLIKIEPTRLKTLSEVSQQIRDFLKSRQVSELMQQKSDQLSEVTYTNPSTLQPAAHELGLLVKTSSWFDRQEGKTDIMAYAKVVDAAFSDDVLNQGNNSSLIPLKDERVVVLRVEKHRPSRLQPLAAVSKTIKTTLTQEMAQAQAVILANKIKMALLNGTVLPVLAKEYHFVLKEAKGVFRDQDIISPLLTQQAFLLHLKKSRASVVVLNKDKVALVTLFAIHSGNWANASQQNQQSVRQELLKQYREWSYQFYVIAARDRAAVKRMHVK